MRQLYLSLANLSFRFSDLSTSKLYINLGMGCLGLLTFLWNLSEHTTGKHLYFFGSRHPDRSFRWGPKSQLHGWISEQDVSEQAVCEQNAVVPGVYFTFMFC